MRGFIISKPLLILLSLCLSPTMVLGKASAGMPESMSEMSLPQREQTDSCSGLVISEVSIPAGGGMNRPLDVGRNAKFHPECYVVINGPLKVHYYWEESQQASMLHASGCGVWKAKARDNIRRTWPTKCQIRVLNAGKFGPSCLCERSGCRSEQPSSLAEGSLRPRRATPPSTAHEDNR
jgi:hypothetical protein